MRSLFQYFLLIGINALFAQSKLQLNFTSTGQNIYIQNPVSGSTNFCTDSVYINGAKVNVDAAAAYEIPLKQLGFQYGRKCSVIIYHKDNCKPKVLNAEMHPPATATTVKNIFVTETSPGRGILNFTADHDSSGHPSSFKIQQSKWGAWRKLDTLISQNYESGANYAVPVYLHSGRNAFRVLHAAGPSQYKYSDSVSIFSSLPEIKVVIDTSNAIIVFSDTCDYMVKMTHKTYSRESYDVIQMKGRAKTIEVKPFRGKKITLCRDAICEELKIPKRKKR